MMSILAHELLNIKDANVQLGARIYFIQLGRVKGRTKNGLQSNLIGTLNRQPISHIITDICPAVALDVDIVYLSSSLIPKNLFTS